ncbi:hypothetical protein [Bacteroides fragilis]|uniref:hypothetical protein n=1 Tax=Bacteroides fragilis TaxID=817 RepID=UPI0021D41B99|nr:hypothetical protein [Bacteroides fragilis]
MPYRRGGYRPVGGQGRPEFQCPHHRCTNEDLEVSVNEKRFRQDLSVPPARLRDNRSSVADVKKTLSPLAEFFRDMANRELECSVSGFSSEST